MSRLLNSCVALLVRPEAMRASSWRGWPRRRQTAELAVEISADQTHAAALAQLLDGLAQHSKIDGASLHVELADSLVHFDVVEGDFSALGTRTLSAMADASVAELLGDSASDYAVRWTLQRDERHLLVCALPERWLDTLSDAASTRRLGVASIRTGFRTQWNAQMAGTPAADAVFAVAEGAQVLITCVNSGVVTAISHGPWLADSAEPATALIDVHVDRMLTGLGLDLQAARDFVLVSAAPAPHPLAPRWQVRPRVGVGA